MSEKKRWMIALLLFLSAVVASFSVSARIEEFNDRIASGESIDIDDFTFTVTMNKYASAIFISGGGLFQSVPLFGCKDMESFEVCFENTTYDEDENELFAEISIFRYKPDLSITRVMNETEFFVGQEAEVTITITNTGDTASQVILTDDYPQGVEISELEGGCQEHENQVYWQGHLEEDEEKECRFIIMPKKEMHQSFVAHLKYWDGFKWVDKYSSTTTVDVEPVITILTSIVREGYEVDGTTFDFEDENPAVNIGEVLRLLVNITNNYNDKVDVDSLEVTLPPDLVFASTGSLRFNYVNASGNRSSMVWYSDRVRKINDQTLRWEGGITANKSSRLFIINLLAKRTGDSNIVITSDYSYDDISFNDLKHESVKVIEPGVAVRLNLDDQSRLFSAPVRLDDEDDSADIEALHPYRLTAFTQNINKFGKLRNVDVRVFTDIAVFPNVHYSEIEEEGQKIPYSFVLIPPQVSSSQEFRTNISVRYENEYGERHENSTEFRITVAPSKDITINLDSSEGTSLEGGEETEITVSVTNDRLIDLRDVLVEDMIPDELHVEGVHSKRLKLNRESDTDVYKYRLKPPIVHNKTRYDIVTRVSFFDPDSRQEMAFSENTTLTVEPLRPDLSLTVTLDEPEDIFPGTLIPVEYKVVNDEELEVIRDINVYFPIQEEFDLVGPKSFFIDKLDPGEEVTIKNLVKLRPKVVNDSLGINMTRVTYQDSYGNTFDENSSQDTLDVDDALISGPSIFVRTLVPEVINRSTGTLISIEVNNRGSDAASVTVEQGEGSWSVDVPAGSVKNIEYPVKYDSEGNYTLPDPLVKMGFQGLEAYTLGKGAVAVVKYIEGPAPPGAEGAAAAAAPVEAEPEREKVEMSFEEYEKITAVKRRAELIRYSIMALAFIITVVVVLLYINYRRSKGPSAPFMEKG